MKSLTSRAWLAVALSCALVWLSAARPCACPAQAGACAKACCGSPHPDAMVKSCPCGSAFALAAGISAPAPDWALAPGILPAAAAGDDGAARSLAPLADAVFRPTADPGPARGFGERVFAACLFPQAPPAA